ncbi:hypothetical protein [Altericista sp. CCNU0014]|uniref:hypothetical protein n=1 Tax=Altericista sp. CCNU0014 TaxID=3082949 RepID=UPI00384D5594
MSSRQPFRRKARKPKPFAYVASSPALGTTPLRASKVGLRLSWLILLGSFGAIAAALWLSFQYLVNPDLAFWVDRELLGTTHPRQRDRSTPQTLDRIQAALNQEGFAAGQPIVLKSEFALGGEVKTADDIAMPILAKETEGASCSDSCQSIRQLRIYRALQLPWLIRLVLSKPYFRLTEVIAVKGPSGADLLALDQNPSVSVGSSQPLPLTQSEVYNPAPEPGLWLRLTGLQTKGSSVATYGQIFYFNPRRERLDLMLNWVSPSGEVPQWQQVTGDNLPELVVNQTVGIEPQYAIYQLKMADGVARQLRPITLTQPASSARAYLDALTLAKSGLWTPALAQLKQVKQDKFVRWNPEMQAQFDSIQLHARVTQAQANQPSASTVQRILGYLVNGSWTPALDVLQSDRSARSEVREMLLSDTGRLSSRIDTALKITPAESNAIVWGALLRMVRGSEGQAIAWVNRQSNGQTAIANLAHKLFKQLNQPDIPPAPPPQPPASKAIPSPAALPSPKGGASPSPIPASSPSQSASPSSMTETSPAPDVVPSPVTPSPKPSAQDEQSPQNSPSGNF